MRATATQGLTFSEPDPQEQERARQERASRAQAFDARRYAGVYMSTRAPVTSVDKLRGLQCCVRVGVSRDGGLTLRRLGGGWGSEAGAGHVHRSLCAQVLRDDSLLCVDSASHLFESQSRPGSQVRF